jgi:putative ubiquitin-RnfH superfamily antitoxin RatB of RatAB toxin-antitoxin module
MRIEVVYALAREQKIVVVRLPAGACAGDAVAASELGAGRWRLGIGGRVVNADQVLHDGDRVEILRPLLVDPREARRRRVRVRRR